MLLHDKLNNTHFSAAEQTVVDWVLLSSPNQINQVTVKQLAEITFTHPSTMVRLAKKLNYSGWLALRDAYVKEWLYLNSFFPNIDANLPFIATDGTMTIAKKLATLTHDTIEDTFSLMSHNDLSLATQYLLDAHQIQIFGASANLLVAQDFALKMNHIGRLTHTVGLIAEDLYSAHNLANSDLAILISYTGENPTLIQIAHILRQKKIPFISITSIGDNTISQLANANLRLTTREKLYSKIGAFTINSSLSYLLNVLYSTVFSANYTKNFNHLVEIGQLVDKRTSSLDVISE